MGEYVAPNVTGLEPFRLSVSGRREFMQVLNEEVGVELFSVVEVPGDFVKNVTEIEATGLPVGSMLTPASAAVLYPCRAENNATKYVLHTEPGVPRDVRPAHTAKLKWYDDDWLSDFASHITYIVARLGHLPYEVEIHPGTSQHRRNTVPMLAAGIIQLSRALEAEWKRPPRLMLENRTGHIVQRGRQMLELWDELGRQSCTTARSFGFTVDFQQLFTANGKDNDRLGADMASIPRDSVRGVHVHRKHRVPEVGDGIDWAAVRAFCSELPDDILVLPEVHHRSMVSPTCRFCEDELSIVPSEQTGLLQRSMV